MPYTLKTNQISVKDPETGEYSGVDILAEQTEQGLIAELQAEGTTQVNRINQAAVDVQSAVDKAETDAAKIISDTQTSVNALEAQKNTIAQTVASMAELGTDTTLSTPGMAADAGAVGDLSRQISDVESELNSRIITVNSWAPGKYIKKDGSIDTISANTVAITDMIDVYNCVQISVKATKWEYGSAWDFAFYTADKTFISGNKYYDPGVDVNNIVIPANAYYFRASTINNDAEFSGDYVSLTYYKRIADIEALVRQTIVIGAGNYGFIDGMKLAKSMQNCDVYILPGEYDISSQIETLHSDASTKYGLPLGWNNHYYFEPGSKVIANYTSSDSAVKDEFAPFSADLDGSNFLLSGLWLECDSLRYCIHDEGGGEPGNVYCHEYKNCHIIGTNLTYNACIGGGLGYRTEIIIDGCYFSGAGSATGNYLSDVFYHGNYAASIADDSISRLYVRNNYFEHLFAIVYLNHAGEEIYCFYSGNSASGNISYETGHADVIAYNNVIR